jgi:cardiolipin synthase
MDGSTSVSPWRLLRPKLRDLATPLNLMTLSRLPLVIPLFYFLSLGSTLGTWAAVGVLGLWALGDWLDGRLARGWQMGNQLGIALDPLVDRLSTAGALVALVMYRGFPVWAAAALVARELIMVLAGSLLALRAGRGRPSNTLGKLNQCLIGVCVALYVVRAPGTGIALGVVLVTAFSTSISYAVSLRRV